MKRPNQVSIGLRAKTGRAVAVVLGGPPNAPFVFRKFEMSLVDPKLAATSQPYHEVMELSWEESQKAVRKSVNAIEAIARKALSGLIKELQSEGLKLTAVGIVGAKDRDLARIGSYHIRAHAAEGVLFRRVLEVAAGANKLTRRTFPDRGFEELVKTELGPQSASLELRLRELGRSLPPPWRTDEKQAAAAAWLALHRHK